MNAPVPFRRALAASLLVALSSCNSTTSRNVLLINPTSNVVAIGGDDTILWNGEPIALDQLKPVLEESAALEPEPRLRFEPHVKASYELSADVLRLMKETGVTNFGFVGNEKLPAEGQPAN